MSLNAKNVGETNYINMGSGNHLQLEQHNLDSKVKYFIIIYLLFKTIQ